MCRKRNSVEAQVRGHILRLDPCIRERIVIMNNEGLETVGSCCGHGVYPRSILVRTTSGKVFAFIGRRRPILISRTRNFYRMDKNGFYYIPEAKQRAKEEAGK